jgi:hypothetical protein
MKKIKQLIFLLLIQPAASGQTAHVGGDRIVYKGNLQVDAVKKDELYARAKTALLNNVKGKEQTVIEDNIEQGKITAQGIIWLVTPYHLIRTVEYVFEMKVEDGSYQYRIDSVYFEEKERGGKAVKTSSEDLVKRMEITGLTSVNTERLLNEIDMNFQKVIDLINAGMNKPGEIKRTE